MTPPIRCELALSDRRTSPDDGYFAGRPSPTSDPDVGSATPGAPPGGTPPALRLWVVAVAVVSGLLTLGLAGLLLSGADPTARGIAGSAGSTDPQPVTPYDGPGSFRIWVTNPDGSAVRWDPCSPVSWVLNQEGAPPQALADVRTAFDRLSAVTDLRFEFEGFTDEVPARTRQPYQPDRWGDRWAPVLVAWAPSGTGGLDLSDHDRAVTVPVSVDEGAGGVFVTGQVVFNAGRSLQPGFVTRQSHWGGTILHELGHLTGLDHVDDDGELMYPRPGLGPPRFGPGDEAGLERLGADKGCLVQPTPQHVDVEFAP